ncbi:MAG: hypothetical protein KJO07_10185, partial [Deltaproteobacteria bacterium]|nr:hypothetical protein [Deltaproteobacteria bacterium]
WQVEQGTLLYQSGDFGLADLDSIDYVSFSDPNQGGAGSGEIFGSNSSGMLGCAPLLYAQAGEGQVSFHAPGLSLLSVSLASVTENEVTLIDADGEETILRRVEEVPASSVCNEAELQVRATLPVGPASFAGLVANGNTLQFSGDDAMLYTFNPSNDELTSAPFVGVQSSWEHFLAAQDGDLWGHCGCGGSREAVRVSPAGAEVDRIDTELFLAEGLSVRGIAVTSTNVILAGRDRATNQEKLLFFDLSGDILEDDIELRVSQRSIAFKGDELWVQTDTVGPVLASLDIGTGLSSQTLVAPEGFSVRSFAWLGDDLYIMAFDGEANGYVLLGP